MDLHHADSIAHSRQIAPSVLGILITAQCNLTCRHCCNESHPRNRGAVPFESIARVIEMAADIPSITEIGISGGEPFLFVSLLRQTVELAASFGYSSSITTNGFWANQPDRAAPLLADLKQGGLRALNISTSRFHQEFVPLSRVMDAVEIALAAQLDVTVNLVATASGSRIELETALGGLTDRVQIVVMPCLPAGRGKSDVMRAEFPEGTASPSGNCREHFRKLAIDGSGRVYPCCSPGGFTPPLLMGNVADESLDSILARSTNHKLLAILEEVGPQFFLPFLRQALPESTLPDHFSDQCHLCHLMLSSPACVEVVMDATEQLFLEVNRLSQTVS